jgi:hypothetical protein
VVISTEDVVRGRYASVGRYKSRIDLTDDRRRTKSDDNSWPGELKNAVIYIQKSKVTSLDKYFEFLKGRYQIKKL